MCGTWWRFGWFDSFQPKGHGFDSHVRTLGKSLTHSCLRRFGVKLRHSIRAVSGALLSRNGLNKWMSMICVIDTIRSFLVGTNEIILYARRYKDILLTLYQIKSAIAKLLVCISVPGQNPGRSSLTMAKVSILSALKSYIGFRIWLLWISTLAIL